MHQLQRPVAVETLGHDEAVEDGLLHDQRQPVRDLVGDRAREVSFQVLAQRLYGSDKVHTLGGDCVLVVAGEAMPLLVAVGDERRLQLLPEGVHQQALAGGAHVLVAAELRRQEVDARIGLRDGRVDDLGTEGC